jgi:hypothetical protein
MLLSAWTEGRELAAGVQILRQLMERIEAASVLEHSSRPLRSKLVADGWNDCPERGRYLTHFT